MNGSMFGIHPKMPFTSKRREREHEQAVLEQHRMDRETREATRRDAYAANQDLEQVFMKIDRNPKSALGTQSKAEKSKFIFKDDDEDTDEDEKLKEEEQDYKVDVLRSLVSEIHDLAVEEGSQTQSHIRVIDRNNEKVSRHLNAYHTGIFANNSTARQGG